ncbi:unnamed protein product [Discula destructiva]
MPMSLRFKYGIHTFFLLIEPLDTFATIDQALIEALHDRAEPILATTTELVPKINEKTKMPEIDPITGEQIEEWLPADPVPVPGKDEDLCIDYGVLKDIHDVSKGYENLDIQPDDTPASRGLKSNDELAFVIRRADEASEPAEFQVKQPIWEAEADEEDDVQQNTSDPKGGSGKGKGKGKQAVNSVESGDMDLDED